MRLPPVLRAADPGDLPALAAFIVTYGQRPDAHCLHSWAGETEETLREQLSILQQSGELLYVLAGQDGRLLGSLGAEFDLELGRAWLRGPHFASLEAWDALAQPLYERLIAGLPPGIRQFSAYLNVENSRARRFYEQQGFIAGESLNDDYQLDFARRLPSIEHACLPLAEQHTDSFDALFSALFPNAYYSPARIRQMNGGSHRVFAIAGGAETLGFVVASADEGGASGEIQFLGVRPDCQRRGYGRCLLFCAIDWLFDQAQVGWIGLNVNRNTPHARRLYESVGFELRFTGVGLKKSTPE